MLQWKGESYANLPLIFSPSRIQQMVQALSVFVVGLNKQQHRIMPWFTAEQGLTDEDLVTLKLVGVNKESVQSSVYRLEISCLDISPDEPNLLTSPLYLDGHWIFDFLSKAAFYKVRKKVRH